MADREQRSVAVLLFNISGLRLINQSFGSAAGDELLCQVAERLQDSCPRVLPLHLVVDGQDVRLFSLLAGFGSALDAGMEELRLECFCPVDDGSERWLTSLVVDAR